MLNRFVCDFLCVSKNNYLFKIKLRRDWLVSLTIKKSKILTLLTCIIISAAYILCQIVHRFWASANQVLRKLVVKIVVVRRAYRGIHVRRRRRQRQQRWRRHRRVS